MEKKDLKRIGKTVFVHPVCGQSVKLQTTGYNVIRNAEEMEQTAEM